MTTQTFVIPAYGVHFENETLGDQKYNRTAICKAIRNDIKVAKKAGALPKELKATVKKSEVKAIVITMDWPGHNFSKSELVMRHFKLYSGTMYWSNDAGRYVTIEENRVIETLKAIANAYDYDKSDSMYDHFDCNFYLSIVTHYGKQEAEKAEWKEANKELLADLAIAYHSNRTEFYNIVAGLQ